MDKKERLRRDPRVLKQNKIKHRQRISNDPKYSIRVRVEKGLLNWAASEWAERRIEEKMGWNKQRVSKVNIYPSCGYNWSEEQKRRVLKRTSSNLSWYQEIE